MDVTSLAPVWSYAALANLLKFLYAGGTAVGALTCHLFAAGPGVLTPGWTLGDLTEAAFTGYASVVVTPSGAPVNLAQGSGLAFLENALFTCTTAPVSPGVQILGYWIQSAGTPDLPLVAEIFRTPVPIVNAGDYLNLAAYIPADFIVSTP